MSDTEISADTELAEEDTITSEVISEADTDSSDTNPPQLDVVRNENITNYSLRRLEQDLQMLHIKWRAVENELGEREVRIGELADECESLRDQHETLLSKKRELEAELLEEQQSGAAGRTRLDEFEAQNVELRVQIQELNDYIDGRKADWDRQNKQLRDYEDTIDGINASLEEHDNIVQVKDEEKRSCPTG